jgi:uncharacterized protein (TIRG00374 family)
VSLPPLAARALRLLLILAGIAVIAWLIHEVGVRAVWETMSALGWRLALLVVFPYSLAVVLDTLGWGVLLRDRHVPFVVLLRARLAGEAVNLTTPTASVGGEPLKAYLLRPHVPMTEALASVVVDKTTVITGQALLLVVGIAIAAWHMPLSSPLVVGMSVLLVIQIVCIGGFVMVQTLGVFGGSGRFLGKMGLDAARRYQDGLETLDRGLAAFYRDRRGRIVGSTLLHGAAWATGGVEIYLLIAFLGIDASMMASLAIDAFGAAVKFASFMIPASLGALDGGYVAFFAAFGLSGAVGLSYTLIRRVREVAWAVAGYIWLVVLGRRTSLVPSLASDDAQA